jgi:hypothetical protein
MLALSDPTVTQDGAALADELGVDDLAGGNGHGPAEALDATIADSALAPAPADSEADTAVAPQPPAAPAPSPPVALLRRRLVRGRYRSAAVGWQLDLRVDVDGARPMNRVSGDFFQSSGATTSYFGSFVVEGAAISTTPTEVRIEGLGRFSWAAAAPLVRVTIPRVSLRAAHAPATVQFLTPPNTPGASYLCTFASRFFRTVQWEQDSVAGTVPFVSYDTGSLPQPPGSPARILSVSKAFGEAGIELQETGVPNVIPVSAAGPESSPTWTDSELHNAMVNHFSLFANQPQWRVWMLVATTHAEGARGIMFDYGDAFQRQGAAVFYDAIRGTDAASQRAMLRTYVHELGHAFNLMHSWQKNLADPPQPLGPNGGLGDLSWMNYAWKYQPAPPAAGGEPAYWAGFPFAFSDSELVHLRHGFHKNVIMGADPFGTNAAEIDPDLFSEPLTDNSGLALELRGKEAFGYGEPVVVELKLSATDLRGKDTHGYLHPKDDFVSLAIRQPSGRVVLYRPLMRRCVDEDRSVRLDPGQPAIYDSAYVGFGRDGQYFDQPGQYELRAQYTAADGSRVVSPVMRTRVRPPGSAEDEQVGELMMGEEQGQLLALLGSDSESLRRGREALDTVLEEHGDHPLAVYARLAKGINCQRDYKDLTADKRINVREAESKDAAKLLAAVEQASTGDAGVDNITLNMAMRRQARAEARAGAPAKAAKVMDRMVSLFEQKGVNPHVLQKIRGQAESVKESIADDSGSGKGR